MLSDVSETLYDVLEVSNKTSKIFEFVKRMVTASFLKTFANRNLRKNCKNFCKKMRK